MQETNYKQQERYEHFPFVQGEILEKHRAQLGDQLKNELKSYLGTRKVAALSQTGSMRNGSPTKSVSGYSIGSFASSNRLSKNPGQTVAGIKALHDSCYVTPTQNFRVLQDGDPIKSAAMNEAAKRYE